MFPRLHFSLERWKKNKTYDVYVSNCGNVRSCKDHAPMEQRIDGKGYNIVFTKNGTVPVHRLVGETWLQKTKEDGTTIDHIDNNKRNNSVKNLRWLSAELNCEYSLYRTYLTKEDKQEVEKVKVKDVPIPATNYTNTLLDTFKVSNDYMECGKILQELLENKTAFLVADSVTSFKRTKDLYQKGVFIGSNTPDKKTLFRELARTIKKHSTCYGHTWTLRDSITGDVIQNE